MKPLAALAKLYQKNSQNDLRKPRSSVFVNDPPDALEALTLLFADDDKMVPSQTQNMNLHISLIAAWDWSKKWDLPINPTNCNYLTIERDAPLMGLVPPSLYPN